MVALQMWHHCRPAVVLLAFVVSAGCGSGMAGARIGSVQPATVAEGDFVLIAGNGFAPGDSVWVGETRMQSVVWVNDTTLTAVAPPGVADGVLPLEVRASDGRRARATVRVQAPRPSAPGAVSVERAPALQPATPTAAPATPATRTLPPVVATPAQAPATAASPPASRPPISRSPAPRGDDAGERDDQKKKNDDKEKRDQDKRPERGRGR